ncbi:MAG: XdhC family protein [Acidobacteriota bacterium]|nr:XdhC family protein [Acidobacteriota bacterium]
MKKELELWQFVVARLKHKKSVMLLVVAESSGSSPGRRGFKMAVAEDEICGSIGGGVMEVRLVEQAKGKRQKAKGKIDAEIIEQVHREKSLNSSGMICSGKQTVIFFRLDSLHLKTVRKIIRALKIHQPKVLHITPDKFQLVENQLEDFNFECKGENDFLFAEKLGFKNKLFIVGGGHCALALSELVSKMDFYITLFDDRPNLNTVAKNKFIHEKIIIESYEQIGNFILPGTNHFIVVMTLGYKFDEIVIRKLIDRDFKYFGVLGSRAKMATLLRDLRKEGFDKKRLNQIRTPIGLQINSRTPEEIAVSIAAEIIAVKNKI